MNEKTLHGFQPREGGFQVSGEFVLTELELKDIK